MSLGCDDLAAPGWHCYRTPATVRDLVDDGAADS